MDFATIAAQSTASFTEKRSEFIATLAPVQTPEQAIEHIEQIRAAHRKAKHNVYAYLLRADHITRYSDDGEPQGTAGVPVLDVLQKRGLTDVCCVVTRYFGGILLGGGGLVRAYSHATSLAVEVAQIQQMRACTRLRLLMDYTLYGKVNFALPTFHPLIVDTAFGDNVTMELLVMNDRLDAMQKCLTDLSFGRLNFQVCGEEYGDFASVLTQT